jgi:SanA protein
MMKSSTKLFYFGVSTIIIMVLSINNTLPYSTMNIVLPYVIYSTTSLLALWIVVNLFFRTFTCHAISRTTLGKTLAAWGISVLFGSLTNHLLLLKLLENSANHPVYTLGKTIFLGLSGFALLALWHFVFKFFHYALSLDRTLKASKVFFLFVFLITMLLVFGSVINIYVIFSSKSKIQTVNNISPQSTEIVFGAGVYQSKYPSKVLSDRIHTAVSLYSSSKIKNIILSGDGSENNNEVKVMVQSAINAGIPESAIIIDKGGLRTLDTCTRAHEVFGVTKAILVTQKFHLPRALFLCNHSGIKSTGVVANNENYPFNEKAVWYFREFFATILGWVEIVTN